MTLIWLVAALAQQELRVPEGYKVSVWAEGLENPVSLSVDDRGRVFVVEVLRPRQLLTTHDENLALRTVADREAMLRRRLGTDAPAKTGDRVRLFQDLDLSGHAEQVGVFAEGFDSVLDGPASGILARRNEVWLGNVPHLWRLRDRDGDGKVEDRKPIFTGFGVRPGFAHDLAAIALGPDGKLYLAMGDRGLNVRNAEGERLEYVDMGTVLRCDPDGGNLEAFAIGLRNPRDLGFDAHGNLWTVEDGAGLGDESRWVWVVEGGDGGWRAGFQQASDLWGAPAEGQLPGPGAKSLWIAEELWKGTAPGMVPPVGLIGPGPMGRFAGSPEGFFLCGPTGVRVVTVKAKGAGFELEGSRPFLEGAGAADCKFAPDGALYVAVGGKIHRIARAEAATDAAKILREGMAQRPVDELAALMGHVDPRVRTSAQHELVGRQGSTQALIAVSRKSDAPTLARLHAVWGLGQLYTRNPLFPLLRDKDPEVRAQTAKVLGDRRVGDAFDDLVRTLRDESPRVRLFAAIALGKIGRREGGKPLLEMLRANDDQDPYLRHAGMYALASINDGQVLRDAAKDPSKAVRLAALLAMRRCGRQDITAFLEDREPALVFEAARAINDLPISAAMPRLAELLEKVPEAAMLRAINANYRRGTAESATRLAKFAARADAPEAMRVEALRALGAWARPNGRDRVVGLWRPLDARDPAPAREALKPLLAALSADASERVRKAAAEAAGDHSR